MATKLCSNRRRVEISQSQHCSSVMGPPPLPRLGRAGDSFLRHALFLKNFTPAISAISSGKQSNRSLPHHSNDETKGQTSISPEEFLAQKPFNNQDIAKPPTTLRRLCTALKQVLAFFQSPSKLHINYLNRFPKVRSFIAEREFLEGKAREGSWSGPMTAEQRCHREILSGI